MAAIFYFLTAFTAIWYYRKVITEGAGNFILGGMLPGFGAAFMAFVIIYSLATGQLTTTNIIFGFGLAIVGLILSFISAAVGHATFYSDPSHELRRQACRRPAPCVRPCEQRGSGDAERRSFAAAVGDPASTA